MLRIATQTPQETDPQEEQQETPEVEQAEEQALQDQKFSADKVDQATAGYRAGGCTCSTCHFYEDPNSCKMVSGTIDPDGWCNIYTTGDQEGPMDQMPEETPEESPVNEQPV